VVLAIGAPLQQELVLRVEDQDREGTVELPVPLRIELASGTQVLIPIVDEDDLFPGIALGGHLEVTGCQRRYDSSTQA
jgi:hypothetical protein